MKGRNDITAFSAGFSSRTPATHANSGLNLGGAMIPSFLFAALNSCIFPFPPLQRPP